jgi:hypothetical protein
MATGAPHSWTGKQVRVVHNVDNSGVLSVGGTRGVLDEVNEEGFVLLVTKRSGEVPHYFPRTSAIKIILENAQ